MLLVEVVDSIHMLKNRGRNELRPYPFVTIDLNHVGATDRSPLHIGNDHVDRVGAHGQPIR